MCASTAPKAWLQKYKPEMLPSPLNNNLLWVHLGYKDLGSVPSHLAVWLGLLCTQSSAKCPQMLLEAKGEGCPVMPPHWTRAD